MTVQASVRDGMRLIDKGGNEVLYRYVQAGDDIDSITELLHQAYAPLAVRGMQFFASHLVTLKHSDATRGSAFYEQPDVASFGQFAVRPSHQGRGIGTVLLRLVEQRAFELGVRHLALDTAEHATELIALYERKGFGFIEYVRWPDVNYRSVVLAKALP